MEPRVAALRLVGVRPVRRHPAGPAETPGAAELRRLRRPCGERQLHIPIELVADEEEYGIREPLALLSGGEEALVFGKILHMDADADLVLHAEDTAADQSVHAESAPLLAEQRTLARVERKAGSD